MRHLKQVDNNENFFFFEAHSCSISRRRVIFIGLLKFGLEKNTESPL